MAVQAVYAWQKGDKNLAKNLVPTRSIPEWKNMAETVIFRYSDGVDVEADKKVMRYASGVVRGLLDAVGDINVGTIILVPYPSYLIRASISLCVMRYDLDLMTKDDYDFPGTVDNPPQTSRKTPADESKFDKDVWEARVLEELGVALDLEKIRRVHEVAKYLDIKFLQELTETLIMRAPSREFMEMVSPWVDYSSLETYRSHHVEACRNLEVAVQ